MNSVRTFCIQRVTVVSATLISVLLLSAGFSAQLNAAYCSLRDPLIAINTLFPQEDQHRSIVRAISQADRQQISEELPFTLHFNEIGQHTLYVALQEKQAIGFVQARSELSSLGIIEVAWAMNLDMSIKGFFFQRCRIPECSGVLPYQLAKDLEGKTSNDLLLMLDQTSTQLTPSLQLQYGTKSDLVLAIIRSALKTLAVTQITWRDDIATLRRQALATKYFGPLSRVTLQPLLNSVDTPESPQHSIIQSNTIKAFVVISNGKIVGRLVESSWQQSELKGNLNWLFSKDGTLLDLQTSSKWPNQEVANAFQQVIGTDFSSQQECSNAVELAGKSLFTLLFTTP